jgi:hypothetical protein
MRLFPPHHYEKPVLCWHEEEWGRPSADDWEQLFGLPRGYTLTPESPEHPEERERSRLAMLANSWHVPVARLFFLGMLLACGVPCEGAEIGEHLLTTIQPGVAVPFDQLWVLKDADFAPEYLDLLPEPPRTLALPRAHGFTTLPEGYFLKWCRERHVLLLLCLLFVGLALGCLLSIRSPAPLVPRPVANPALLVHVSTLLEHSAASVCASACTFARTHLIRFFSALMPYQQLSRMHISFLFAVAFAGNCAKSSAWALFKFATKCDEALFSFCFTLLVVFVLCGALFGVRCWKAAAASPGRRAHRRVKKPAKGWCMSCCRRRRLQQLQEERVQDRWRRLLRHLRRLRRLQRVFAYSGHLLQHYPAGLRQRMRQLL